MAYTPTTWATGDTITATALNKMEQGIANGGSATIITDTNGTLDKTFAEIYNLIATGSVCYIKCLSDTPSDLDTPYAYSAHLLQIAQVLKYDNSYRIYAINSSKLTVNNVFAAGTPAIWCYSVTNSNDYPTFYRRVTTNATTSVVTASTDKE